MLAAVILGFVKGRQRVCLFFLCCLVCIVGVYVILDFMNIIGRFILYLFALVLDIILLSQAETIRVTTPGVFLFV